MSLALLLVASASAPFAFKGGTPSEFAMALGSHLQRPIAIGVCTKTIPRMEVEWPKDASGHPLELEEGLKNQLIAIAETSGDWFDFSSRLVLRPAVLPWYRFSSFYEGRNPVAEYPEDMSLVEVTAGTVVTKNVDGKYFLPVYLPFKQFAKRVVCHEFLQQSPVAFSQARVPEGDFIAMLASAIGGRIVESEDSVFIDVDFKVLRSQMVAYFDQMSRTQTSRVLATKAKFQAEIARIAPEENLRKIVDLKGHTTNFRIQPGSRAEELASEYVRVYLEEAGKPKDGDPHASRTVAQIVREQGNLKRPFLATLNTNGRINVMVMIGSDAGGVSF